MAKMSLGTKIKLGVSAVLIILVVLDSNPAEVSDAMGQVDLMLIGLVVVLYMVNLGVKAYRWSVLMNATGNKVKFRSIFTAFSLSQAINNLIPGRVVGETSRIVEMNAKEGVKIGKGLASVVTERIMDFAVLTILCVTSLLLLLVSIVDDLRGYLIFLVIAMVAVNVFFIYILAKPSIVKRIAGWGARLLKKVVKGERGEKYAGKMMDMVDSFNDAVTYKGEWKSMLWASVLTGVIWVNEILRLYIIIVALGVDVTLVAVIAASSLASLSGVILSAGSGNVVMSSAVFGAAGLDANVAATAGLLSAITSIWLSVPVSLLAMYLDGRRSKASSNKVQTNCKRDY
jgi:glycosyltransferase 2 family protein